MPEDTTSMAQLLEEVDISPKLTQVQLSQLKEVLERHKEVFGLDGQLGHYTEEVEIRLLPNTKPISIPPFQVSPAN